MENIWPNVFAHSGTVFLAGVVPEIFGAGMLGETEHALGLLAEEPEISHLHGTRSLPFDGIVDDAYGGCVVNVYRGGWLGMSHFG